MSKVKVTAKTGMTFIDCLAWLKINGPSVGKLGKAGDKEARILMAAYEAVHRDQINTDKQNELINIVSAYMNRELRVSEAVDLANKYGHKVKHFGN